MRLHRHLLKHCCQQGTERGFTLVELLIAATVGSVISIATSQMLLSHMRSSSSLETTQRLREDWNRTSHFIESEVALSERVLTQASLINLNQCTTPITNSEFRFALEIRRDLPPAIYFIRNNASGNLNWRGSSSLWRCGPAIDSSGEYTNLISGNTTSTITAQILVDAMESGTCDLEASNTSQGTSKSLEYTLCIQGLKKYSYSQSVNTYSRVSPVFSYPNTNTLCSDEFLTIEGFYKLSGGTTGAETLQVPSLALHDYDDILICGYGGGDTINGSTANDVLEAGDSGGTAEPGATMNGGDGSDRLLGGPGNDLLNGGNGDDVLIGGLGDDTLNGGPGENQYLPEAGNNVIEGGAGLDIVFLNLEKDDVSGLDECSRASCNLTYSINGTSSSAKAKDIEVIIFRDGRHDITN